MKETELDYIGLSFVRNAKDFAEVSKYIISKVKMNSKIETRQVINNIDEILNSIEYVIIDRGNLSTVIRLKKSNCSAVYYE